jgi:hypothetical protein
LDVETLESLEDAVLAYPGSVLFVTHDRAFAKAVATRVMTIDHGELIEFTKGFAGYETFRKGQREVLDPARLLEGEAPPEAPKPLTPEQELQIAEERSLELEELFLHRGLTEREWHRLRLEARHNLERRAELYADRYNAALEFDHTMRVKPLEIRAMSDETGIEWQFWAKGSSGCPSLRGQLENGLMHLTWLEPEREALRWFKRALLKGALSLSLERIGANAAELPEALEPFETRISSVEYAQRLKLTRMPKRKNKRRSRKKKRSLEARTAVVQVATQSKVRSIPEPTPEPKLEPVTVLPTAPKRRRRRRKKPVLVAA